MLGIKEGVSPVSAHEGKFTGFLVQLALQCQEPSLYVGDMRGGPHVASGTWKHTDGGRGIEGPG